MNTRLISVLVFGAVGAAILISLGVWQLQRLSWKQDVLAEIEARIAAEPVALPDTIDVERDRYLPVTAQGQFTGDATRVLVSVQGTGPGYRLISAFETGGREVLVDRGFIVEAAWPHVTPEGPLNVTGNLHWPDEVDGFTPDPDIAGSMWFAREIETMARHLDTEPVLLVSRVSDEDPVAVTPLPVTTTGIPNNHLQYAITWFLLAAVWSVMTLYFMISQRRRTKKD